jgi:hypothetical protein
VPALTGYIDKARDKQYIAQARNVVIAARTVIDEAYADGEWANSKNPGLAVGYLASGDYSSVGRPKVWNSSPLSTFIAGNADDTGRYEFQKRISALLGEEAPIGDGENYYEENGYWYFYIIGSKDSTVLNADGFCWLLFPEGEGQKNHPAIIVTYKLDRVDITALSDNIYDNFMTTFIENPDAIRPYNPNAGYEVYHLDTWH